jgi:phosphate:Na+ symporter
VLPGEHTKDPLMTENATTYTLALMGLVGGVGLFLFGMECLVRMFQQAAGPGVRRILTRAGRNQWSGLAAGTAASALLHSGPVAVILIGLVNAGIIGFRSTFGMVAGANLGTTFAIQVIAFDIGRYSFLLLGIGMLARMFLKGKIWMHLTLGVVGFGLLFLGLEVMKTSMEPLKESELLMGMLSSLHVDTWGGILVGVLTGLLLTCILQSSGAAISILFSLAALGMLPGLGSIIPMLLGIQIGKCIPAALASVGSTLDAFRVMVAHVGFNVLACVIGIATLPVAAWLVTQTSASPIRQVANYNTAIMLVTALVLVPFGSLGAVVVERITRSSRRTKASSSHLDIELAPYP